jgi:SHS family lactate transporter-like MFS transporter
MRDAWRLVRLLTPQQRKTFLASFLGWSLDAFDFFLVVVTASAIAAEFGFFLPAVPGHKPVPNIVPITLAITLTLAMRPVGALLFGILADHIGRRVPLMIDIALFSAFEFLTAFSPNFAVFLVLRMLFGVAMGGEWGLGAALAMESLPGESRGLFSGILQQGYACGYLLAAVVSLLVFPYFGWRGMFVVGALPALVVLLIRSGVEESPAIEEQRARGELGTKGVRGMWDVVKRNWALLLYLVVLMTAFNFMSHGSQDVYPTFLGDQAKLALVPRNALIILYNVGAICGGTLFGYYSQRWGRRRAIMIAAGLGLVLTPLWAGLLSMTTVALAVGAFLMQFMVQGAWGVIPVHLNELSPGAVRGTFPGFAYQLGNLFAAITPTLIAALALRFGPTRGVPNYSTAQALVLAVVFVAVILITALGREAHGKDLKTTSDKLLPAPPGETGLTV